MKKALKWVFAVLAVVFVLLQFTNPSRTNPPVIRDFIADTRPPQQIVTMLHATCYDCHSSETKWPWYSRIAPMSWLIASDVNEGRENLNLSDWPRDPIINAKRLGRMSEIIGYGDMPPKKYTAIHTDARLTDSQKKELTDWMDGQVLRYRALSSD